MLGWGKRQTKRKVKCSAGANAKPKGKLNAPPGLPVGDDKKCKKELSSDAVALSGEFFYSELRSTIVRVALPSFVLLVIKALLKTYHREDLIAALVDYQMLSIETDRQRFVLQNMSVGFC